MTAYQTRHLTLLCPLCWAGLSLWAVGFAATCERLGVTLVGGRT